MTTESDVRKWRLIDRTQFMTVMDWNKDKFDAKRHEQNAEILFPPPANAHAKGERTRWWLAHIYEYKRALFTGQQPEYNPVPFAVIDKLAG